ncbi:response regulator [Rhizobium cauense]|uniref:response regulator n=1 Tax=Rhizobium cauense TaxID=1166683 RepID=UPI001C6DEB1C|nr:response regulator [Rhizobium cauense]MBW9117677.1 response regulator [Rhizobium cauense]
MDNLLLGKVILVVEDDFFLDAELCAEFIAHGSTIVGPVSNVKLTLELIATECMDAALLDIRLGAENAYLIADALSARETPFVFASTGDRMRVPGRFNGYRLLNKPVEFDDIVDALFGPI